jgi:hypothetical protein
MDRPGRMLAEMCHAPGVRAAMFAAPMIVGFPSCSVYLDWYFALLTLVKSEVRTSDCRFKDLQNPVIQSYRVLVPIEYENYILNLSRRFGEIIGDCETVGASNHQRFGVRIALRDLPAGP